jgi:hypothetical protein
MRRAWLGALGRGVVILTAVGAFALLAASGALQHGVDDAIAPREAPPSAW